MTFFGFLSIVTILFLCSGTVVVGIITSITKPVKKQWNILKPLKPQLRSILIRKFPYYRNLTDIQRKDFEKRLKYFLASKEFIPINMEEVTDEMKVLIGACAVQITFGYEPIKFAHFKKIILYPSKYYSKFSKRNHRGEVNPNGMIILSWEDFLKGYGIPNDGLNVGLHEMAHALRLEDAIQGEEYAFLDNKKLARWHKISMVEMRRLRRGQTRFLRRYAAIEQEEFFAVCIEQFFEQPNEFKMAMPELFHALSQLLNQDPTQFYRPISEAYKITT